MLLVEGELSQNTKTLPSELKIATLNYCGIMNNPFEFYNETYMKQFLEISQVFNQTVHYHGKAVQGPKFNWGMGKVETKVRIGRYSPSFHLNIGFEGERFLTRTQFYDRWDKAYKTTTEKSGLKFDQKNITSARQYDFIFFHALLRYVFKKQDYELLIKEDPKVYVKALEKFYDASYLDDGKKLVKVKESLLKIDADVLFIQQYSPLLEEYISTLPHLYYRTDDSKDTIIVIKRSSFGQIVETKSVLSQQQIDSINWNEKTAILIVDNIILVNAHLNSKKEKNREQMESLRLNLVKLKKDHLNYHFILGGDLNAFFKPELEFNKWFNMYPSDEKEITTVKMRTYAQGQYEKSNIKNEEGKDKIITDFTIVPNSSKVTYIDNETRPDPNSFVPTNDHPFDHFLVVCKVVIRPIEIKIATLNYCGIMNNPFEFYNQKYMKQFLEISEVFNQTVHYHGKAVQGPKFNWGMGKVETKVRIGRYSPSFHLNIGFEGERFLTRTQFYDRWDKAYKTTTEKSGLKFDQKNITSARQYDFIFFHALLRYVFKKQDYELLIKEDPKVYVKALEKFYDASYLDDGKKLVKVKESLLKIDADVLFIQQYSPLLEEYISTLPHLYYRTDDSKDTIIVIKRSSFGQIVETKSVLSQQQIDSINWNEKTAILIVDNIILVNAHLNSKKEKNREQMESLRLNLVKLKKDHLNYHFILGGDLNAFFKPELEFNKWFNMYPSDEKEITTVKMRTYAQGQYEKSNIKNEEGKDKIITDFTIVPNSSKVTYIDNETRPDPNSFVPTDDHPFDHFLVTCKVIVKA